MEICRNFEGGISTIRELPRVYDVGLYEKVK
jgi:hypothetical protein